MTLTSKENMKKNKYSATKTLGQFKWLLLFAFTTSFAVGTRAANQLDIFTGEAQAQEVLESQHTASLPELSPTQTPTPSPTTIVAHPTSTPEPAVEAVDQTSGAGELEEIKNEIEQVFGDEADNAFLILDCENKNLNPKATNHNKDGSIDRGIFQINSVHLKGKARGKDLFDYKQNIEVAHRIYSEQGWSPWSCSHKVGVTPFYLR